MIYILSLVVVWINMECLARIENQGILQENILNNVMVIQEDE